MIYNLIELIIQSGMHMSQEERMILDDDIADQLDWGNQTYPTWKILLWVWFGFLIILILKEIFMQIIKSIRENRKN